MANILFVNKISPLLMGGAETRIREVSRYLARQGHAVYVLCGKTRPDQPREETVDGVCIRCIGVLPDWLLKRLRPGRYLPQAMFYLLSPPALISAVRRWKIDVIRDDMSPFPGLGFCAPFLGRRSIVIIHNLFNTLGNWRRYYGVYGLAGYVFERLLLRGWLRYRSVVTVANWTAAEAVRRARGRVNVVATLNGIHAEDFAARTGRAGNTLRLLNTARFTRHKRHPTLIAACALLMKRGLDFTLDLAGDGPLRNALEAQVNTLGLSNRVRFLGRLAPQRMLSLYAEYDLFVFTSQSEGLPINILEAMAAGLPVVAPDVPYVTSLNPQVYNMLCTFPLDDVNALADAVADVAENPDAAEERVRHAREWVEQQRWEDVAEQEWQAMRPIVEGKSLP